jgi:hypothetical protein
MSNRFIINPFLSDLEQYLAKCDIIRNGPYEDNTTLFLEKGIHPQDFYYRTFNYRNNPQTWNISYSQLLQLIDDHCSHGLRWSFNAWNSSRPLLAFGDERKFKYYALDKINDKVDNISDLVSLLTAGNFYMDFDFSNILSKIEFSENSDTK